MAALGDSYFTQIFTTTLQKFEKTLVDNVLVSHPVLELFKANAKSVSGRGLVIPVRAANLSATGYTDASGTHSTAASADILGSAVYNWADNIVTPFRLKHDEILMNQGEQQIVNLVEEYVKAAKDDHGAFIAAELHKLASAYTTDSLMSLDMIVNTEAGDDALDISNAQWVPVGGILPSAAGKDYWVSTRLSISGATTIVAAFRQVQNAIYTASNKRATHVICGSDVYEELETYLDENNQGNTLGGNADLGFTQIKWKGLIVRLDPECQVDRAYFLNQPSLRMGYCNGEFMKAYPARPFEGTLDTVVPMASKLIFGTAERRANGLLIRT